MYSWFRSEQRRKEKRRRDNVPDGSDDEEARPNQRLRADGTIERRSARDLHMRRDELPVGGESSKVRVLMLQRRLSTDNIFFQTSFQCAIRVACETPDSYTVPLPPGQEELDYFDNQGMSTVENNARGRVMRSAHLVNQVQLRVKQLLEACRASNGTIAKQILQLPERALINIFTKIAESNLLRFAPQYLADPHSAYNRRNMDAVIQGFMESVRLGDYDCVFHVDRQYALNLGWCQTIYMSYVYGNLADDIRKEVSKPGSVAEAKQKAVDSGRRNAVSALSSLIASIFTDTFADARCS